MPASIAYRSACSRCSDDELRKLGRIHTAAEAKAALDVARSTFDRFSFDLIYARPEQSPEAWRAELAEALALAGDHLSLYQLTIEPDTPYAALHAAGKLVVPDDDASSALYEITDELTAARGLRRIRGFELRAARVEESRHNLLYWRYGEYAGIGPGAHGRIFSGRTPPGDGDGTQSGSMGGAGRGTGNGIVEMNELTRAEQADEMLLMGLRLSEGMDLGDLASLGGVRPTLAVVDELVALGLLETSGTLDIARASATPRHIRGEESTSSVACAGPGLAPETFAASEALPVRIRATRGGRLVLNAVVAKLAKSFVPAAA